MIWSIRDSKWFKPEFEKLERRRSSKAHGSISNTVSRRQAIVLTEMWYEMVAFNDHFICTMINDEVSGYSSESRPTVNMKTTFDRALGQTTNDETGTVVYPVEILKRQYMEDRSRFNRMTNQFPADSGYLFSTGYSLVDSPSNMPSYMREVAHDGAAVLSSLGFITYHQMTYSTRTMVMDSATIMLQIFWDDLEPQERRYFFAACLSSITVPGKKDNDDLLSDMEYLFRTADSMRKFHEYAGDNSISFEGKQKIVQEFQEGPSYQEHLDAGIPREIASMIPLNRELQNWANGNHTAGYENPEKVIEDGVYALSLARKNGYSREAMMQITRLDSEPGGNEKEILLRKVQSANDLYENATEKIRQRFLDVLELLGDKSEIVFPTNISWNRRHGSIALTVMSFAMSISDDFDELKRTVDSIFNSQVVSWHERTEGFTRYVPMSWIEAGMTVEEYNDMNGENYPDLQSCLSEALGMTLEEVRAIPASWIRSYLQ